MRFSAITALALAATLLTLACERSPLATELDTLDPDALLAYHSASVDRPFYATWEAVGPPPPPVAPLPEHGCSADAVGVQTHRFEGQGAHLGHFRMDAVMCIYVTYYEGTASIVSANGDVLEMEYGNGRLVGMDGPMIYYQDDFEFTGGTGRFASASGEGVEDISFDTRVGWGTGTMTGTIRYAGSDRATRP